MGNSEKQYKKVKWHRRHVTIDTPCKLIEVESILQAVSDNGWASTAEITVEDDRIVITYGEDEQ